MLLVGKWTDTIGFIEMAKDKKISRREYLKKLLEMGPEEFGILGSRSEREDLFDPDDFDGYKFLARIVQLYIGAFIQFPEVVGLPVLRFGDYLRVTFNSEENVSGGPDLELSFYGATEGFTTFEFMNSDHDARLRIQDLFFDNGAVSGKTGLDEYVKVLVDTPAGVVVRYLRLYE